MLSTKGDRDAAEQWRQRSVDGQGADAKALPFNRVVAPARYAACASDHAETLRLLREAVTAGLKDHAGEADPWAVSVRACLAMRGLPLNLRLDGVRGPLFSILPYPRYGRMATDDVEAIVAYLRFRRSCTCSRSTATRRCRRSAAGPPRGG